VAFVSVFSSKLGGLIFALQKSQDIVMKLEDVSFQFLREITDGFSEKRILGEGAFGVVY